MKPRRTPETSVCLELPDGNEDNYLWMWPAVDEDGNDMMVTFWETTEKEREAIAAGKKIMLVVYGRRHPPVGMTVDEHPEG